MMEAGRNLHKYKGVYHMNLYYSGKSYRRSHRRSRLPRFLAAAACIVLIGALGTGIFFLRKQHQNHDPGSTGSIVISTEPDNTEAPTEGDGFVMPETPAADLLPFLGAGR